LFDTGFVFSAAGAPDRVMNPVPRDVVVELAPSFPLVMLPVPNFDVVDDAPELSRLM
jgi:hypothetical protein